MRILPLRFAHKSVTEQLHSDLDAVNGRRNVAETALRARGWAGGFVRIQQHWSTFTDGPSGPAFGCSRPDLG